MDTSKPKSRTSPAGPATSRRKTLRLAAPLGLTCSVSGLGASVSVQDIGLGGVAIKTSRPIARGSTLLLLLQFGDLRLAVEARVAHCQREDANQWRLGLAFVSDSTSQATVDDFLDAIAASTLSFS